MPLLEIANLNVALQKHGDAIPIVDDASLEIGQGEIVGLVGESGSGKTMLAMAVLRLLPRSLQVSGTVRLAGRDLLEMPESAVRRVRGGQIGMVFQEPTLALNPAFTIGTQIKACLRAHQRMTVRCRGSR